MLRVNSLLYIEKLWYQPTVYEVVKQDETIIQNTLRSVPSIPIIEQSQEVLEVEEEPLQVQLQKYTIDQVELEIDNSQSEEEIEEEMEEEEEEEEEEEDTKRDSKMLEENEESNKILDTSEDVSPIDNQPASLSSSSSSILPPTTPTSIQSNQNDIAIERPRTTSLIRRETAKLNDRRRSLTKKLKRALTVKSENGKRNSM